MMIGGNNVLCYVKTGQEVSMEYPVFCSSNKACVTSLESWAKKDSRVKYDEELDTLVTDDLKCFQDWQEIRDFLVSVYETDCGEIAQSLSTEEFGFYVDEVAEKTKSCTDVVELCDVKYALMMKQLRWIRKLNELISSLNKN